MNKPLWQRRKQRRQQVTKQTVRSLQPCLEPLESRVMLSASLDAGVLALTGTDGNDRIEVAAGARPAR